MDLPTTFSPPRERLYTGAAWLYLALLPCHLQLVGPLYLHDLLLPLFLAAVLQRADWRRWLRLPDASLAAFGAWCLVATVTRLPVWLDLYELGVFGYMGLLYVFFSRTSLSPRGLWRYAVAVTVALWLVGAVQVATGLVQPHSAYVGTTLGFLATRYGFTFGNPNLLGSFAALPVACALLSLVPAAAGAGQGTAVVPRGRLLALGVLLLALGVPLLLTASRHLLLSGALVLGALTALTPAPHRHLACRFAGLVLALVFALFYLTILVPCFPLQAQAPFVNCRTPGMYLIHQGAYLNLLLVDPRAPLLGLGRSAVRQRYPEAVDPDLTRRVLAEYHMEPLTPSFLVYMDAHNDYLNLATAFGLPAVAALYAFFGLLARTVRRSGAALVMPLLTFLVLAVCMASLWDDLLSKRWIWVTLGILAASAWNGIPSDPRSLNSPPYPPGPRSL
jgi:hypothetical protein